MSQTQPLPPKKDVALALLERSSVYVHLDPRQATVVVPALHKKKPQLVLQVGLNMPVPIPDLRLDDDGITCTLSFSHKAFYCVVPWASVFALVGEDGRGMVWPDDVPVEVARQAQVRVVEGGAQNREPAKAAVARDSTDESPKAKRARKRPVLAAVPDAGEKEAAVKAVKAARVGAERPALATQSGASRPGGAPASPARSVAGGSRKKKKDLPPYLRIVK